MPLVASVDYTAKRIYLHADTAVGSPTPSDLDTVEVYKEVRALRRLNEDHRKFRPIIIAGGNVPKITGSTWTAKFAQLLYGTRMIPYDGSHKLKLIRDTFTDDGFAGRDCFDRDPLTPGVEVDIDVDFPEVEIRAVNTGSGLTAGQAAALAAIQAKTDQLAFTKANEVDANLKSVNDTEVAGSGTGGDPWGPV